MKSDEQKAFLDTLLTLRSALMNARDNAEEEDVPESENDTPCTLCGGDCSENDFLSRGANNPIFHCSATDSNVDIVTMKQDVTTFEVSLEEDAEKFYTYKTDLDIVVGDWVLVETPYGYQSAQVEVVHDEPHFIVDDYTIRWAICKLPLEAYKAHQAADAAFGAVLSAEIEEAAANAQATAESNKLADTRADLDKLLSPGK